ncbi:MAG: hypothetical protein UHE86_06520, partial [Acutalibacteraceae bacterium]|nr:hypothetical protein [Acutalibacteraceae bacterium]
IKKSTNHFGWCFILLFVIVQGFEQGGSEEVRKQFGELFLPTWATSVSETIAHDSVRKNPYSSANKEKH